MREIIKVPNIHEQYIKVKHSSGLTVFMCPLEGYSSLYAQFSARYGSLDTSFRTGPNDGYKRVPAGIAHFLEHKMFEDEDGDAFQKFGQYGASANAFTSFDRTCYEVLCTDHFMSSLELLIKMVTGPYFTDESVQKEQGIIGQEITMFQDNPDWRVYFNLLRALYHIHPITIDIAGTTQSIGLINKELLYDCYDTFYNLNNMVLSVSGKFDPEQVLALCDKLLVPAKEALIGREPVEEPEEVRTNFTSQSLPVSLPMFEIGYKNVPYAENEKIRKSLVNDIVLEILAGEGSPLYSKLYNSGLIADSFDYEGMVERGMCCNVFSGESAQPQTVLDEVAKEIEKAKKKGVDAKDFERVKKNFYGRLVMAYNNVESIANAMTSAFIENHAAFEALSILEELDIDEVQDALNYHFDGDKMSLSIIEPKA